MPPPSAARAAQQEGARGFIGNANDATAHWFGADSARARHHAARADRLCRLHRARGRDVPRDLPRRGPDRAGRLFRPGGDGRPGGLPPLPRARRGRAAGGAARHPWRALPRGARPGGELRRAGTPRAAAPSAATAARRNCATWSAPASPPPPIWRMREALDEAGFPKVRIVASSGFGVGKCRVMAEAKAPIDVVGTGSFIPDVWSRDLRHRRHRRL